MTSSFFLGVILVDAAAFGALRLALHRVEAGTFHWLFTFPAYEAIRVPLAIESRDVVLHDWSTAAATFRSKQLEVIVLTVGLAMLLMETIFTERVTAVGAEEVLRMPGLV